MGWVWLFWLVSTVITHFKGRKEAGHLGWGGPVAPLALILVPVDVGGDAALAVHVGAPGAVDLHPLVHEGADLRDGMGYIETSVFMRMELGWCEVAFRYSLHLRCSR